MTDSYDLTKLGTAEFENIVNALARQVLGNGHTGFGPGPDGGRDGFFEGQAPYPSEAEMWSGTWYIQSKFHKPNLSSNHNAWLIEQVRSEISEFQKPNTKRHWPDNWIIATNVDPSGVPGSGSFDKTRELVREAHPKLEKHFHIWGGQTIVDLLNQHPKIAEQYSHFLTPSSIISAIYDHLRDSHAQVRTILRYLIVRQFDEQKFTKLEQAGSSSDTRPGIHDLFIDLPFRVESHQVEGLVTEYLLQASAENHRLGQSSYGTEWRKWKQHPSRARMWFIKGGPGQGKSTIGQHFCQIQRARLILEGDDFQVSPQQKDTALEVKRKSEERGLWPQYARVPISVDLKDYAQWMVGRAKFESCGITTYLADQITAKVEEHVLPATIKRALGSRSWFVAFDGLDEVPHDLKDTVASELRIFSDDIAVEAQADLLSICTSRPQGYSGQFNGIDGPTINLVPLSQEQALSCARPVISINRSEQEIDKAMEILTSAIRSNSVGELMTTPLQSHIMAIIVRDGGRPPERRWQLFNTFYNVIRKREADRSLPDSKLAKILTEGEQLLKSVHSRLGFILHARAESSEGAQTHLSRDEFRSLVHGAVTRQFEENIEETVDVLMTATEERLVLVNTPDDGEHFRFDVRPLQEFFAAEFIYDSDTPEHLKKRIATIAGDAHWREVMHFLLSALIENRRYTDLIVSVSVLEAIDQGESDNETSQFRILNRRLGRGALLSARLLQEGVLEQDRRMRQMFCNCIEPLAAFTDEGLLVSLLSTNSRNSQSWLFKYLIELIKEKNHAESIGAAIVLASGIEDGNIQSPVIHDLLINSSHSYLGYVLSILNNKVSAFRLYSGYADRKNHPNWLVDVSLKILLRRDWFALGNNGVIGALATLWSKPQSYDDLALHNTLSPFELKLLRTFHSLYTSATHEHQSSDTLEAKEFGIFRISYRQKDWTQGSCTIDSWTVSALSTDVAHGILFFLQRSLIFISSQDVSDAMKFLSAIDDEYIDTIGVLPPTLLSHLPLTMYSGGEIRQITQSIALLKTLDEESFTALLKGGQYESYVLLRPWSMLVFKPDFTNADWEQSLEIFLDYMLAVWSFRDGMKSSDADGNYKKTALIEKLLTRPLSLSRSPLSWAILLKQDPGRQVELHQAFLRAADMPVQSVVHLPDDLFNGMESTPVFNVQLPEQATYIPHLIHAMVRRFSSIGANKNEIGEHIEGYFPDPNLLIDVVRTSTHSCTLKGAAALCFILHPNGNTNLSDWQSVLVEGYDDKQELWYLRILSFGLSLISDEEDVASCWIMNHLLESTRSNYQHTQQLQEVLSVWREKSHAPVQKAGDIMAWLAETHTP